MGGNSFDLIAEEIVKQQQIMEQLQEENRRLHRQLADLREGRGICLQIGDQQFALGGTQVAIVEGAASEVIAPPIVDQPELSRAEQQEQTAAPGKDSQPVASPIWGEKKETAATAKNTMSKKTTFLEEIMIDEFSSALTAPVSAVPAPAKKPEMSEEEKKAALRRDLMGSYLLE